VGQVGLLSINNQQVERSVSFGLAIPVPLVGAPVESAMPLVLLTPDSVSSALVDVLVPFSLPPQLLSTRPPTSKAARNKREVERCMEVESEG
jgi:hypothetical protein